MNPARKIALIGFGAIGAELHAALLQESATRRVVSVLARDSAQTRELAAGLRVDDVEALLAAAPDLVIEAAHPDVVCQSGQRILQVADFMPLSLTALADETLLTALLGTAQRHATRLYVPHGAIVGADALLESRAQWQDVAIEFRKPPASVGAAEAAPGGERPVAASVLFDGSARDIATRYPRNVNAMVACALLTVGLDRCRARLIADPALTRAELHIHATGVDGSELFIVRRQPIVGVSGTEMARSLLGSVKRVCGSSESLQFV